MAGEFSAAGERIIQGLMAGMYQAELEIFRESQIQVPVETATLKASGRVFEPERVGNEIVGVLGYGYGEDSINPVTGMRAAGYAIPVHERFDVRHDPPTKAKYLEDPVLEYSGRLESTLAASIQRAEKMPDGQLRTWMEQIANDAIREQPHDVGPAKRREEHQDAE